MVFGHAEGTVLLSTCESVNKVSVFAHIVIADGVLVFIVLAK